MRIRLMGLVIAGATAATVAGLRLTVTPTPEPPAPASEEVPPCDPPRMADGHPDLNGLLYGPCRRCSVAIAVVSLSLAGQALVPWNVDPEERMYEYACRDDNYNMVDLLIGGRSQEANGETTDLD